LYVHILTSNDSIADDTCLGIPKCCWILQPATGETALSLHCRWTIHYWCHATVDSCQTLNSSPFGGFDHSHSRSFCNQKDQHSYSRTHDTRQLGMTSVVPLSKIQIHQRHVGIISSLLLLRKTELLDTVVKYICILHTSK
jgi:hypothetical protein